MTTAHVDHLVYAVPDLDAAIAEFAETLGVAPAFGGRHEGFGTHNALLGLGACLYLELLAPDPTQSVTSPLFPSAREPQLIGWAVSTPDIDATIAAARAAGYDPGEPVDMQRARPDGVLLAWRLTRPSFDGDVMPFLIDWGDSPHPADSAPAGVGLDEFTIAHPDPRGAQSRLRALGIDLPVREGPAALSAALRADGKSVTLR